MTVFFTNRLLIDTETSEKILTISTEGITTSLLMISAGNGQRLKIGMSNYCCGKKSRERANMEEIELVLEQFFTNYGVIFADEKKTVYGQGVFSL